MKSKRITIEFDWNYGSYGGLNEPTLHFWNIFRTCAMSRLMTS